MEKVKYVQKIGNFISNLLLGQTKEVIIRTDEKVKTIEATLRKIEKSINVISSNMTAQEVDIMGLKVHTKYGITNSPTIPGKEGSRLLAQSGFEAQYPELENKIFTIMDRKKPRTLYDYEIGAFEALTQLKDDPLMDPLKDHAVNHPGESLDLIFRVASWVVRDKYATYKELGSPNSGS
ncbi:MAG: hypothetical protein WA843_04380 [Candidatus Saccharimonadales bacterium]